MRRLAILVLSLAFVRCAAAREDGGCSATAYAPDAIPVRSEPASKASSVQSIPKSSTASLVRADAFSAQGGDWLKISSEKYNGWVSARHVVCRLPSKAAQDIVAEQAEQVQKALKGGDVAALAQYVHPVKGLRFSPYATVDRKDVVLTAEQLRGAMQDPAKRVWGFDDGSGAPMRLSFAHYYHKFVYDRDFSRAAKVAYNSPGPGTNKAWERYPNAIVADYSLPEAGKTAEEHLRLVFEEHAGKWYLSGIIHDGWTI